MTDAIDQVQHAKSTLQRKTAKFDESLREADTEAAGKAFLKGMSLLQADMVSEVEQRNDSDGELPAGAGGKLEPQFGA